ncbi:LacI family DNA-binding transcriptional regulator [Cellulomonas denverensis]|uniref:LacI family transcriptional regulator n=1 Tax=Cellulomonas denverensis TaxID=264297 RepID=A0A7X6KYM9_9CELL|nr:LacI family DNA-binding transcriptional regulator [Cellulomonas denverensis]NKY24485.1 LacI family transcriptional regulator [Cellulomonas denverensis]
MSTPPAAGAGAGQGTERPTLADIAAAEIVSVATVSKVLNDRKGVSPETRERVTRALERAGYRKRGSERLYAPQIEIVFGSLAGEWAIELIRGASRVARAHDLTLSVVESGVRFGVAPGWARAAAQRQPAGIILVASELPDRDRAQLHSRTIPFVVVDPSGDPPPDAPSVGSTNWAGGVAAARHLIELGHRRIGVVAGPNDLMATRARVAGFRSAMEAAGLPVDPELIVVDEFQNETAPEAALRLLDLADPPTAIFATSDLKALGVYAAARERGIRIPEDLSVVGYDDLSLARWAGPPLTTVRQPLADMAAAAGDIIVRDRTNLTLSTDRIELATSLVQRDSTAPPR